MFIKQQLLIVFIMLSAVLCSCSYVGKNDGKVLELSYKTYGNSSEESNQKNVVYNDTIFSVDSQAVSTKTVIIADSEYNLKYSKSLFYPVGDYDFDVYTVENTDNNVLFSKSGTLTAVLFDFAHIDISENETAENILPLIKPVLEKFENFLEYECVEFSNGSGINPDTFGIYDFFFYNTVNGYKTDVCRVSVNCKGHLFALRFYNMTSTDKNANFNIDKNLETKLLTDKLKDIYNTEKKEFVSYSVNEQPQIVKYDGRLYIKSVVSVIYKNELGNEVHDWLREFMVPLDQVVTK